MAKKIKVKLPKPKIKFNGGARAILCNQCNVIIKEKLNNEELKGKTDLIYCSTCAIQAIEKYIKTRYT